MILLDTNILLRRQDRGPGLRHGGYSGQHASRPGEVLCVVPQDVYEFWATATRPIAANGLGLSVPECQAQVVRIKRLFRFFPDLPTLFAEWEALVVTHACHGRASFDARLVAAMRPHGIARLLTLNRGDFTRFPGLSILDPTTIAAAAAPPPSTTP